MGPDRHARRDRWCAAGLGLFAVGYLAAGRGYSLDTLAAPGPGVFPLAAGLVLLTVAIWQFAAAGRQRPPDAPAAAPRPRTPLVLAGALVLYAAAFPRLGFLVTSFALVFVAARLMGLG
ncbi:MAG TPA: tripartite tricarboxylate transporter TctB family protein, partial [Methylomirabilota bacterium]|nr:tripartite tricarboxylate transporter TctB family protein [Methylomirabilota bacterium]